MDTQFDEYLAILNDEQWSAIKELRNTIRIAAPDAEECIGFRIPKFRLIKMLVGFAATSKHLAFYLMDSITVEKNKNELKGFDTSAGSIRFQADNPVPTDIVLKLVNDRLSAYRLKKKKENNDIRNPHTI